MTDVNLEDMRIKTNLDTLIEEILKNSKPDDIDKAIYICQASEIAQEKILGTRNITVINGEIYSYGPKETEIHRYVTSYLMDAIYKEILQMTGYKWRDCSNMLPIANIYNCGASQYKYPDGNIYDIDDMNKIVITIETAFTHETTEQLYYELIHQVSEFTGCTYSIGAKLDQKGESFEMVLVIVQRTTEINQEKIEYLQNLLNKNIFSKDVCVKRKRIASVDDISPEKFNTKVVFFKVINDLNIDESISFSLDGAIIDLPGKLINIHIYSDILKRIMKLWLEYKSKH